MRAKFAVALIFGAAQFVVQDSAVAQGGSALTPDSGSRAFDLTNNLKIQNALHQKLNELKLDLKLEAQKKRSTLKSIEDLNLNSIRNLRIEANKNIGSESKNASLTFTLSPNKGSSIYQLSVASGIAISTIRSPFIVAPSTMDDRTRALIGPKILIGNGVQPGQFPWQVALLNSTTGNLFCGGSYLRDGWIVTAAHCFQDSPEKARLKRADFIVFYGSTSLVDGGHRAFALTDPVLHEQYDPKTLANDIALVKVSPPAGIPSMPLPTASDDPQFLAANTTLLITGWGQTTERGSISVDLLQASVPVADLANCRNAYNGLFPVTNDQFCAGSDQSDGADTCQGDSGGPITHFDALQNKRVVLGVTSFGFGCGHKAHPSVYTRLLTYLPWLTARVGAAIATNQNNGGQ